MVTTELAGGAAPPLRRISAQVTLAVIRMASAQMPQTRAACFWVGDMEELSD